MSNSDSWQDFDQVRHSIRNNTVDRLKQIVAGFNEECGLHMAKSGKKQELIDRIVDALDQWRRTNTEDRWTKARAIVAQVRSLGQYLPPNRVGVGASQSASASHVAYDPPKPNLYTPSVSGQNSSSSIGHYDPYAPPRRPTQAVNSPVASSSSATNNHKLPIRFKESPFFSIEQAVSGVTECPESTSATDRRVASFTFSLSNDQLSKMKTPGSKYQLRLFCTSSGFYTFSTFRTSPFPCPIEFPPTCEVRINTTPVQASLKGLKKKPGTAPPPDISALTRLSGSNKVDMVYVNSQQPVQSKKFYIIVMLVEATTTDALVAKLKTQNYRSFEDIQEKMRQSMNEDEDIVAGPQKMSLKCPLTFVRISTPCRSEKCVHPQCFDATSWFTMMEMTTTWLCPVCERVLEFKDLIIDGYFDAILKVTPDSVEDVVVEADGEWHTTDNEYASAKWKATHPPQASSPPTKTPQIASPVQPVMNGLSQVNGKGKEAEVEILVLDSDEDDDERPEPSPSYTSSRTSFDASRESALPLHLPLAPQPRNKTVIDLTLDDSDEDQPPPPNFGKRKASDANLADALPDQLWKKGRIDSSRILPTPRPSAPINPGIRPVLNSHPPSPNSMRYPSFPNNTLPPPPVFPAYNRSISSTSSNSPVQLPPISTAFSHRQPTPSHHHAWP